MDRSSTVSIGVVVIGRNEGARLERALRSVLNGPSSGWRTAALYADSGSTDRSVAVSKDLGVAVHELDRTSPFSAARGRLEGAERLMEENPELEFIQFLDGDCTLVDSWLSSAADYLQQHPDVGVVCGRLEEESSDASVYNRMNAIRWRGAPPGDVDSCGGIFCIRASVYRAIGGFNPLLLTGEEAELCSRVRRAGHRIVRLDRPMASHDSGLTRFSDWWDRAVWGGYGDALEYRILSGVVSAGRRRETRSVFVWGLGVPTITVIGILGALWTPWLALLPLLCVGGYAVLFARIVRYRRRCGDSYRDASLYSLLSIVRKVPSALGFVRCALTADSTAARPDPHGASN